MLILAWNSPCQEALSRSTASAQRANTLQAIGHWRSDRQPIWLESGEALRNTDTLADSVVNVINGVPVYLKDVATVTDDTAEPDSYQ